MSAEEAGVRDIVQVHIRADLPIRSQALPFADRVEIRLGKAFPVALIVDRPALDQLGDAIAAGRAELEQSDNTRRG
ncbi:hypothetical protein [Actinophytocola sp.]|uniref:hypothetical protein n=1 Tax=Actinophytocola sp. TaxID=1872138 RepID=UPI002D561DD2|nr:hypothetical protein [Actinophytocola sp.]HYQ66723.1 hypothetical protein [Actinophytocola sp.]